MEKTIKITGEKVQISDGYLFRVLLVLLSTRLVIYLTLMLLRWQPVMDQ